MDRRAITLLLSLGFCGVISVPLKRDEPTCGYQACPAVDETKINIHLLPHSHDDVGWLKTVDQYYYGSHKEIQDAGVQYIISSYVEALKSNPSRRFIQVETAFWWKWWQHQDDSVKQDFIDLVNRGQVEIINGAWSMNDEAATNYHSTIDQFTWAFRKLNETLGDCGRPKIGWQIDPFGHSREQASIFKQLGFDGLVIGRLDYRDKEKRYTDKNLDFIWKSSANLDNSNLFTSMFPEMYGTIGEFCWDVHCGSAPINDEESSPDYNLKEKVDDFADKMDDYAAYYQTKNIMVPMGGDFEYQAAELNFLNIDKLIKGFKDHEKYNVFYSTPSCYIKAVNDEVNKNSVKLTQKTDDFFPYASDSHAFWTGYFTSRPTSKRFERTGNNILQAAKQLAAFSKVNGKDKDSSIVPLREVMGVMQHHDAITGTEKQRVAQDYARQLTKAIEQAEKPIGVIIGDLLKKDDKTNIDLKLSTCLLANVSICDTTKVDNFFVAVYNPLAHTVSHYVRLPVEDGAYKITGPDGEEVNDVLDSLSTFDYIPDATPSPKELVFKAKDLPPLGVKFYYVEKSSKGSRSYKEAESDDDLTFGTTTNGFVIDKSTKKLKSVTIQGQELEITQEFMYYSATVGDNSEESKRSSGAYVFRPTEVDAKPISTDPIVIKQQKGSLVDEVKQVINDEVTQIIRVYKGDDDSYIEFDWLVGNLEVDEKTETGREVITRFTVTDFANKGVFYTDSNGREQIKRELNKRSDYTYDYNEEPVASNYYPVTSRIVIKDETKHLEVAVLNDRAQGGTSLSDGAIELMVHRRLLHDDSFGVNEALNEREFDKGLYVRGQHYLTFGSTKTKVKGDKSSAAHQRELAHRKLLAPWVLVGDATAKGFSLEDLQKAINFKFAGLKVQLPENVHLLTLEPWQGDTYILRLEHTLEKGEDDTLSAAATVNLTGLFSTFSVGDIRETTLGANQWLEDYEQQDKMEWGDDFKESKTANAAAKPDPLEIALNPMQIRTFVIQAGDPKDDGDDDDNNGKGDDDGGDDDGSMIKPTSLLLTLMFTIYIFIF